MDRCRGYEEVWGVRNYWFGYCGEYKNKVFWFFWGGIGFGNKGKGRFKIEKDRCFSRSKELWV